jgi:signal transduction histidine kinase
MDATAQGERLRALIEAGIALGSELSLEALLQRIVETAAKLTGARYAALGVIDPAGRELERFLTHGIDAETHAAIGSLPRGRGILGVLINDARPLRLRDLAEDPRAVGFPPGHPPMHTFLGVPILLRGVAYGNLYLTEKEGGEQFTEEDEDLVRLLAAQAAVAIENARLYEAATRWSRRLESLTEVGDALAGELELSRLLELVADRLRELVGARLVLVVLPVGGELRISVAAGEGGEHLVGLRLDYEHSKAGRVFHRRRTERIDSVWDDPEIDQAAARLTAMRTALYVPLLVRERAYGVLLAVDKHTADPRFTDDDVRLAETFASRAGIALSLSEQVTRDALRRVVEAQELERKRLSRELHDETGQALTSVLLGLRAVEDAVTPEEARRAATAVRELVVSTLQDVRRLAVELRPKALDDFGVVPAVQRLAQTVSERAGLRVDFEQRLGEDRLPPEVETAVYRIVQEALTNVVKYADATTVSIVVTRKEGAVAALVEDDGRGFDPAAAGGYGLLGMRERVELLEGRLDVESAPGSGTTVIAEVPLP